MGRANKVRGGERAARAGVILAAGLGTRMKSPRAKVLHPLGGLPLVTWCVRAIRPLVGRVVVVIGHERDAVRAALEGEGVEFAVQEEQRGTGHALSRAAAQVAEHGRMVVLAGDVPLLTTASLLQVLSRHEARDASATVASFLAADPSGYGRIVRGGDGEIRAIVEEKQATATERAVREVNSGLYAFETKDVLARLQALPARGEELYLTDVIEGLVRDGRRVEVVELHEDEVAGINTQQQLAAAEARYKRDRLAALMAAGVTITDPATTTVEADVEVGAGTILRSHVALTGRTVIGERCDLGPMVYLDGARIPDGTVLRGGTSAPSGPR